MNAPADKMQENKGRSIANDVYQEGILGVSTLQFVDKRPEAITLRKLQEMAGNSPQAMQSKAFQEMANISQLTKQATQLRAMVNKRPAQQLQPTQKKENKTGLPDDLKSGAENLSGYTMDDVRVHYNSDKPAQLHAHAYAQGANIHLASGQEKHLPHEAWHVIQQKQGRVKPTMQMKGKLNINDDKGLEKEADMMGEKALQNKTANENGFILSSPIHVEGTVQRVERDEFLDYGYMMKDYIPEFGMGRFDITLYPKSGIAKIVVKMHVNFSDEKIGSGLDPWTQEEKLNWKFDANESVKKIWNNITEFTITNKDWLPIKIQPKFSVSFVDSEEESHVTTNAVKVPQPMKRMGIWDGGRNGLMQDQFTSGPMTPTRALLSQIAPKFRKDTPSGQNHHNIFAHEFGHMIGLSDEYDNETDVETGPGKRQDGNVSLMEKYGAAEPEWGSHSSSLMSDGTQLLTRHFLTVRDAIEKVTMSQLPEATVVMTIREGNPIWMELTNERFKLNEAIRSISNPKLGMAPYQIQASLIREFEYEESQIQMADGNIDQLLQILAKLHQQRREYYEVFIDEKKTKLIDPPVDDVDTTTFDQFITDFLAIPWNI